MYINMHLDDIIQYDHLMKEEPKEWESFDKLFHENLLERIDSGSLFSDIEIFLIQIKTETNCAHKVDIIKHWASYLFISNIPNAHAMPCKNLNVLYTLAFLKLLDIYTFKIRTDPKNDLIANVIVRAEDVLIKLIRYEKIKESTDSYLCCYLYPLIEEILDAICKYDRCVDIIGRKLKKEEITLWALTPGTWWSGIRAQTLSKPTKLESIRYWILSRFF